MAVAQIQMEALLDHAVPKRSMGMNQLARLEPILRAAIGAFGLAAFADIEEDAGVVVPHLHACLFAGAENAALGIEVGGAEFDRFVHDCAP